MLNKYIKSSKNDLLFFLCFDRIASYRKGGIYVKI